MATSLYELHSSNTPDIEDQFMRLTGIEIAMGEQSQTHNDSKLMRLRDDTYKGKSISIEPHVKISSQRAGIDYQRIYYCYDRELSMIIIGHVGDHLKTYGSMFIS